jgi:alkylhydroperoxidase family enzyme
MAHIPLVDKPKGIIPRLAFGYGKRRFGRVAQPVAAAAHHSGVLVAMGTLETTVQLGLKKLHPTLRWLALQMAASTIGCSWCIDYGYYEGMHNGIDPDKVRAVGQWRDSILFDKQERAVLEYAEKASGTPAEVSDELAARLRDLFSDAEIVELAAWVALENQRSRFNAGLGLHSQGFAESCEIPPTRSDMAKSRPAAVA